MLACPFAELGPADRDAQGGFVLGFQLASMIGGNPGKEQKGQ